MKPRIFRCGAAARWLPRTLGAAVLVASMLLSARIHGGVAGTAWSHSRTLVVLIGAVLGLLIVRSGAWVRAEFSLSKESLAVGLGRHRRELPFDQIVAMSYETPFVQPRQWLPALVLVDRFEKQWRVPALLSEGRRFVEELTAAAGREDLRALASVHRLCARMSAVRGRLAWGYGVALAMLLAAAAFYIHGGTAGS